MLKRGDIYYIDKAVTTGSEQAAGRPGIIVSNDINNKYSSVVEIIYLTGKAKNNMPTHVQIKSSFKPSIALCEQVSSVSTLRLSRYVGRCTDDEMRQIDQAMMISLGIGWEYE